jgi:two-component system phosphate regulon sensor histidine kinase PhoR
VHQNAERLQHIVEDLLDLSRLESGRWTPDLVDTDPLLIAEEAWQALEGKRKERRIDFRIDAPAPAIALADPLALRQIFSNLFDNAIRYTPDGGSVTVRIARTPGTDRAPGRVAVAVSDTGIGIPQDGVTRIFERFYRIDPARARAEGGTGLGLAIVKHLIESMGGDVAAESQLGHGTTIRFRLPEG